MDRIKDKLIDIKHSSKFLTRLWYLGRQPMFKKAEKKIQENAKKDYSQSRVHLFVAEVRN